MIANARLLINIIKKEIIDFFKRYYGIIIIIFFLLLLFYRIYNSWHFNPYWGYDGGEHINYLFSLIKYNLIPSIDVNTIAWHEPLYYFIFWPVGKIIYLLFNGNELIILKNELKDKMS